MGKCRPLARAAHKCRQGHSQGRLTHKCRQVQATRKGHPSAGHSQGPPTRRMGRPLARAAQVQATRKGRPFRNGQVQATSTDRWFGQATRKGRPLRKRGAVQATRKGRPLRKRGAVAKGLRVGESRPLPQVPPAQTPTKPQPGDTKATDWGYSRRGSTRQAGEGMPGHSLHRV